MIIEDLDEKKKLNEIPNADENGEPIYKIAGGDDFDETSDAGEESAQMAEDSRFQDTPQDLKDETSQD